MRPTRRPLALTAALLCAGLTAAAALPGGAAAADRDRPDRVALPGTAPVWTATQATDEGVVPGASRVVARVYLAGRARQALVAEAMAVSDPRSSHYRHFLTPGQIRARFAPSLAQVAAVTAWVTGAGFRVTDSNPHYLAVQGDASAATRAFGAHLHAYRKNGHVYTAPDGLTTVPASVADDVLTVTGLDSSPHQARHGHRDGLPGPASAFVNAPPMSDYYGQRAATTLPEAYGQVMPYAVKGYTGAQLRSAYGATATGLTGAGVRIAVVDAYDSPTLVDDLTRYASAHGDAPYATGQLTRVDAAAWTHTAAPSTSAPDGCGAGGWYGEQTLDLEAVHAVAPAATLSYVGAASCGDADLVDALNKINDRHLADIVSDSWGEPELASDPAMDPVYSKIFTTGALEGIGYFFSSGDGGDEKAATGAKQTDMPASNPWVTAVGGTSLGVGAGGQYLFETGWGTDKAPLAPDGTSWSSLPGAFLAGAGGGTSSRVVQPSYQAPVVPNELATSSGAKHRVVPDIAAVADSGTGFLVGQTQTFPNGIAAYSEYRVGGTSLAAPVIAGIQALAQQEAGGPLGFANPAIYDRYGTQALHDVTDYPYGRKVQLAEVRVDYVNNVDATKGTVTTLRTLGQDSSLQATRGYDDVTGVGSPSEGYITSYGPNRGATASR